jgi:hypothetical protein
VEIEVTKITLSNAKPANESTEHNNLKNTVCETIP